MHLALFLALSFAADSLAVPTPAIVPEIAVAPAPAPQPPSPPAPLVTPAPQAANPDRAFGLGFRVFGEGQQLRFRFANAGSSAFGIDLTWEGQYSAEETENASQSPVYSWNGETGIRTDRQYSNSETEDLSIAVSLPFEWVSAERGNLTLVNSIGPSIRWTKSTSQSDLPSTTSTRFYTKSETTFQLGGTVSGGIRWEFVPGLSLATDFGFDAFVLSNSTEETYEIGGNPILNDVQKSDRTGYGTRSWFGGIGLDAWF